MLHIKSVNLASFQHEGSKRGAVDGVFSGQPVIDSDGLMGQIDEVYDNHSRVLLITDSPHALPVEVARNGLRAIAEGIGDYRQLRLRHKLQFSFVKPFNIARNQAKSNFSAKPMRCNLPVAPLGISSIINTLFFMAFNKASLFFGFFNSLKIY